MNATAHKIGFALALSVLAVPQPVFAQSIDFGDDTSEWALDGECDDMRFTGSGMTSTPLLESDIKHDATDCRVAYEQGRLALRGSGNSSGEQGSSTIQWGDNASEWAFDGECDDMRFTGPGMTSTPLLESDIKHDATDCRVAYEHGLLELET